MVGFSISARNTPTHEIGAVVNELMREHHRGRVAFSSQVLGRVYSKEAENYRSQQVTMEKMRDGSSEILDLGGRKQLMVRGSR